MTEKLQQSAEGNENIDVGFETKDEIIDAQVEKSIEERIEHEANVSSLRSAINLEQIASERDPEGYAQAVRIGLYQSRKVDTERNRLQHDIQFFSSRKQELDGHARHQAELYEKRSKKPLIRFKKFLHLKDRELQKTEQLQRSLEEESKHLTDTIQDLEERATTVDKNNTSDPISEYLEQFETPLSPAEKQKLLKFDALSELSTDEYLQLWKRLNPFFATHVTRQGFRDHSKNPYHSDGYGKYHNGFTGILGDNKELRSDYELTYGDIIREATEERVLSNLERYLFSQDINIESMREAVRVIIRQKSKKGDTSSQIIAKEKQLDYDKAMGWDKMASSIEAELVELRKKEDITIDTAILDDLLSRIPINRFESSSADGWADGTAVHFGRHAVLDDYYGGETGNEAFFLFPTDVLASQCLFGGRMSKGNLTIAETGTNAFGGNDFFVWPKNGVVPIDAGITFLPKSIPVDRQTGSRYASEIKSENGVETKTIKKDEARIAQFSKWLKGLSFDSPEMAATDYEAKKLKEKILQFSTNEEEAKKLLGCFDALKSFISDRHFPNLSDTEEKNPNLSDQERTDLSIRNFVNRKGLFRMAAEDSIPAEEYWEDYFRRNPEKRPKHLVYYDGDPTTAVLSFLQAHDILTPMKGSGDTQQEFTSKSDRSKVDGKLLGFESHFIPDKDAQRENGIIQKQHAAFVEIAKKLIAEHYHLSLSQPQLP